MRFLIVFMFLTSVAFADAKEDMQNIRTKVNLQLTLERVELIEKDADLKILYNNILRTHSRLASILNKHPELLKNKNLKEPKLSQLKIKLLKEDEDLIDIRMSLVRMHRKLELKLMENPRIKELTERVESIDRRIQKLK